MQRRSLLRASDQDREQVAERLRTAALEGRLTHEELDERLGQAYGARTYGELDELVADLPVALPGLAGPPAVRGPMGVARWRRPGMLVRAGGGVAFLAVLAALAGIARSGGVVFGHAARAAGGPMIEHAFGVLAAARLVGAAVVGLAFVLVLVAAVGWALSRPWSTGDAS